MSWPENNNKNQNTSSLYDMSGKDEHPPGSPDRTPIKDPKKKGTVPVKDPRPKKKKRMSSAAYKSRQEVISSLLY